MYILTLYNVYVKVTIVDMAYQLTVKLSDSRDDVVIFFENSKKSNPGIVRKEMEILEKYQ